MTHLIMEDVKTMRYFTNFLFGIYITISFILMFLPIAYTYIPSDTVYNWYLCNYHLVDTIVYINFAISYIVSLILFYFNGYEDGKKENIINGKMD